MAQKFLMHLDSVGAVMSFSVMVRTKRRNVAFSVEAVLAEWNYMMSLKVNSSICH